MKKMRRILFGAIILCIWMFAIPTCVSAETLQWPVPGHTSLSQGLHDKNAIDISDGSIGGANVYAAMGGTVNVIHLCTQQHYGSTHDCNGFGTGLVIKGDDGRTYQYAHMQGGSIPANVYYGAYVAKGQLIGRVGTTGNSSGNHLHFGICWGNYWEGSGNPQGETYNYSVPGYDPQGVADSIACYTHGEVNVSGWAFDRDNLGANLTINVYIGGKLAGTTTANLSRPDVNSAYGITGTHGYSAKFKTDLVGNQRVDIDAVNVGQGKTVQIASKTINITGHSYTATVISEADCTQEGKTEYNCSCGAKKEEITKALGHNYVDKVVTPTFKEKGYTIHTCSRCNDTKIDSYVDAYVMNEDGYVYVDNLPAGITSDSYEIQFKNYYETEATSSPGAGWVQGAKTVDVWQNSGSVYQSETDLPTSDARVLVNSYYYHFCGRNNNNICNYEIGDGCNHWDSIAANRVSAELYAYDNGHPYYFLYMNGSRLWCSSGVTCDGSYGDHGAQGQVWYKMNEYQNRVRITKYLYTKESDYGFTKDSAAKKVTYRFKPKAITITLEVENGEAIAKCKGISSLAGFYNVKEHGFVYSDRVNPKIETSGRTKVVFTDFDDNDSFSCDTDGISELGIRAYIIYDDLNGEEQILYSEMKAL